MARAESSRPGAARRPAPAAPVAPPAELLADLSDVTILNVMDRIFPDEFEGETWDTWRVALAVLFGLPMTDEQFAFYQQCTGRSDVPSKPFTEAWWCCGRRAGKSKILSLICVFLAIFRDWTPYLSRGERGTIMVLAVDKKQAKVIMRYTKGLIDSVPTLKAMVVAETAESIDLDNSVTIEINAASFRSVRGVIRFPVASDIFLPCI